MCKYKDASVSIGSISTVRGAARDWVYGLGDDYRVYIWNTESGRWIKNWDVSNE